MDFNKLIARVKAILMTPKTEWPVIAGEPTSAGDIYKNYVIWLAGAAAIASFISNSIIGHSVFLLGTYRLPVTYGLTHAIVSLVLAVAYTWLFAWLINALAPSFGGTKDSVQATKAAAYAFTAGWVGSIAMIVPVLGWLVAIAGFVYGIYLLYVGLPQTMKCPADKAGAYTAVTVVIAIVAGWILSLVVFGILARAGFGMMGMGGFGGGLSGSVASTFFNSASLGASGASRSAAAFCERRRCTQAHPQPHHAQERGPTTNEVHTGPFGKGPWTAGGRRDGRSTAEAT